MGTVSQFCQGVGAQFILVSIKRVVWGPYMLTNGAQNTLNCTVSVNFLRIWKKCKQFVVFLCFYEGTMSMFEIQRSS